MALCIVTSSTVTHEKRMDAAFHRLANQYRERAAELAARIDIEQARALIRRAYEVHGSNAIEALAPLRRGASQFNAQTLDPVLNEYPHLSLAIMEDRLPQINQERMDRLREAELSIASLNESLEALRPSGMRSA